jgi:hypothetical protein
MSYLLKLAGHARQLPDRADLDAEFEWDDAHWHGKSDPGTTRMLLAVREGSTQRRLEHMAADWCEKHILSRIPPVAASEMYRMPSYYGYRAFFTGEPRELDDDVCGQ